MGKIREKLSKSFDFTRRDIYLFKRLWNTSLKKYVVSVFVAFGFMMISAGGEAYSLSLLKPTFDKAFFEKDHVFMGWIALQIIGVFFLKSLALYAHTYIMGMTGFKATREMQLIVFKKFLDMDLAFFGRQSFGRLSTLFSRDSSIINLFLQSFFTKFAKDILTIIAMVCYMVYLSPQMSLIILVLLPAIAFPLAKLGRKYRAIFGETMIIHENFTTFFMQILQSIPVVKIYGKENAEKQRAKVALTKLLGYEKKGLKISARSRPIMETLGGIAIAGALILGAMQVSKGILTTGDLVAFLAMLFACYRPLKSLSGTFIQMHSAMKGTERLFTLLDEKAEIFDKKNAIELSTKRAKISFKNVDFSYHQDGDKKKVLRNISFEIPAGKTVALVGISGGGKTTIMNLIPRFYEVEKGAIKINDKNIKDLSLKSMRKHMAFVTQDTMLFEGSVAENIAYGSNDEKVSHEEIVQAAKHSAAHDFITKFKKGYKENVGERGGRLSGGQKQRISIARALLKNAPILLLDEATSALDTKSEAIVQKALQTLMKNRTTLVIAHRLSTIINADKIIVIDDGKVIEQGDHNDLLKKKGYYAKLYQMQLKKKDKNATK